MKNNILGVLVGIVIGVILIGSILAPTIEGIQKTAGDEITYTNSMNSKNKYHYDYVDSVDFSATYDTDNSRWSDLTVNGTTIELIDDYMLAILSDGYSLQIGTAGQLSPNIPTDPATSASSYSGTERTIDIVFNGGEWSVTGGSSGVIYSGTYTWVVTYVEDGKYIARNGNPTNFYNSGDASDFIIYSGYYSTGDLDTFYAYGDGKLSIGVQNYTGTVNLNNTLVDGTTDIYKCVTCTMTITDTSTDDSETYTPYRCLVKETVTGHATSGAAYSMYGAIIILAIATLLIIGVRIITNRD